jgi:hypothetical protein
MRAPVTFSRARVIWIPLVLVGSFLYWTTALGLGGLSLTFLGASEEDDLALQDPPPPATDDSVASGEPIVVHLESWSDAHAAAGASGSAADDGTGSLPATDDSDVDSDLPGQTSF